MHPEGPHTHQRHADEAGDGCDGRQDEQVVLVQRCRIGGLGGDHRPGFLGFEQDVLDALDQVHGISLGMAEHLPLVPRRKTPGVFNKNGMKPSMNAGT